MGHIKASGLKGAGMGVTLALCFIGLTMWRLGLSFTRPVATGLGELGILYTMLPYLIAIVIAVFGVVGGLFGMVIGWRNGPGEKSSHPPKDSRHPLE